MLVRQFCGSMEKMVIINGLPSDTISTFLPRWSIEQQIGPTKLLSIQFVKCLYSNET